MSLNSTAPEPPNFYLCDQFYGQNILSADCRNALRLFENQQSLLDGNEHHQTVGSGTCGITVSSFIPDMGVAPAIRVGPARDLAAWIINQCVASVYVGGWGTVGFENMVDYLTDPNVNNVVNAAIQIPQYASFMTVSVQELRRTLDLEHLEPSSFDPGISEALADAFWNARNNLEPQGGDRFWHLTNGANLMEAQAERMHEGGNLPWYQLNLTTFLSNQTAYSCDMNLRSPIPVDCNHLQHSELGSSGDSITVGPGATKALVLKTCNVAVSASIMIVVTWGQIKAALDTLISICVMNPSQPARGGKAYYQIQKPQPPALYARDTITGLNALPPHLNVTLSGI